MKEMKEIFVADATGDDTKFLNELERNEFGLKFWNSH